MDHDYARIIAIEQEAKKHLPVTTRTLILVLCEIGKQLSRIANAYEEAHK